VNAAPHPGAQQAYRCCACRAATAGAAGASWLLSGQSKATVLRTRLHWGLSNLYTTGDKIMLRIVGTAMLSFVSS